MKFLNFMHTFERAVNAWMSHHPWLTILFSVLFLGALMVLWETVSVLLATIIFIGYMALNIVVMFCSAFYLVKSGYKPPCCEKCGQVLPEDENALH